MIDFWASLKSPQQISQLDPHFLFAVILVALNLTRRGNNVVSPLYEKKKIAYTFSCLRWEVKGHGLFKWAV